MKNLILLLIASIGLFSCDKSEFDFQGSNSKTILHSEIVNDDFEIHTYLPQGYSEAKDYPVVFLLDANWYFDSFTKELSDLIQGNDVEPVILIGIGYPDDIDTKRLRDYTYPVDIDLDEESGQAEKFSQFLHTELLPKIEADYGTDTERYTLMGHSLGGFNVLYNLLTTPNHKFSSYVAVSASIWWEEGYLFGMEQSLSDDLSTLDAKVFIGAGEDETPSIPVLNLEMIDRLKSRNYSGFQLHSKLYQGASHSQVPMVGFSDGLKFVLN